MDTWQKFSPIAIASITLYVLYCFNGIFPARRIDSSVLKIFTSNSNITCRENTTEPEQHKPYNDSAVLSEEEIFFKSVEPQFEYFRKRNVFHALKAKIISHPWSLCLKDKGANLDALVYVWSRMSSLDVRNAIRQTWANRTLFPSMNVAFIIGSSMTEPKLNKDVADENKVYGDIIHGDFVDHYTNLTLKSMIQWRWTKYNCMNAKHYVKTDDDTFLNTPKFIEYLRSGTAFGGRKTRAFTCHILSLSHVFGSTSDLFNGSAVQPPVDWHTKPYCNGQIVIMTTDMPVLLYNASFGTVDLWIGF
jgi:hypothetical protein